MWVYVTLSRAGYSGVHKAPLCTPLRTTSQSETSSVHVKLPLHYNAIEGYSIVDVTYLSVFFSLSISTGSKVMEW